jgi:ATPases of the AAA+ class
MRKGYYEYSFKRFALMPSPLLDLFAGRIGGRRAVETIIAHRTFSDVVLPPRTRAALDEALSLVRSHELIFSQWGLGEKHSSGLGLAFNFAGPPGTGKTICAEAIATVLGKKLLSVRYAEMESMWAGETPKNVASVFRMASEQDAVLFFDEADAIASRRTTGAAQAYQRESNTVVNVLLKELEAFNGVVIFATNLAVNFDPAFERRIELMFDSRCQASKSARRSGRFRFIPQRLRSLKMWTFAHWQSVMK